MPFQSASTMLDASVIICAHNPRSDYFARILDGLRNQTLPLHKWELLIVDNASQAPFSLELRYFVAPDRPPHIGARARCCLCPAARNP